MTESMTQAELDAIDAAEREATPGPWGFVPGSVNCPDWDADSIAVVGYSEQDGNNSAFIALSRTAVPRMRGEIDRLKALVEQERRRAEAAEVDLLIHGGCPTCEHRQRKGLSPCKLLNLDMKTAHIRCLSYKWRGIAKEATHAD